MADKVRADSKRGLGWILAHPGWSGVGGVIAVAGFLISIWPQADPPPVAAATTTSTAINTTTVATTVPPTTTTTMLDDPLAVLDVGVRPSVFDDRLGDPTRASPILGSTADPVPGFDLVTWVGDDMVVEAVVDTNDEVVRGYTVTLMSRDLAPSVPHLPDTSQIAVGLDYFADMIVPATGRQGINPANGRWHYAEAFDGGPNTEYRVVVLIASHAAPVELSNRSSSAAIEAFWDLGECLGFGLTELTCEGHPRLETLRSGMVITGYAVTDRGFEDHLALFPENL